MSEGRESMGSSKGKTGKGKVAATSASTKKIVPTISEAEVEHDDLMESLRQHDNAFNSLLSLIPAQFYLAVESEGSSASDEMKGISTKYMKNKRKSDKAIEAEEKKALIKEAKRAKLDPDNFKTVTQIQQERAASKVIQTASSDEMNFEMDEDDLLDGSRAGDTDSEEEEDDNDDDDDDDDTSSNTQLTSVKGSEDIVEKPKSLMEQAPTGILDLRARLQAKIQGLQSKRKAPMLNNDGVDGGNDDESVASTKDELLEERRKKRGEMRDKRRQAMKERRKVEREGGQDKKASLPGNVKKGVATPNGNSKAPTLLVADRASGSKDHHHHRTDASLASGDIAFSSIQFGDEQGLKGKKNRHSLPSDPKAALAILEARKKKDEARAAKRGEQGSDGDNNKAMDLERKERERWSKAEAAAQGVKIRDDEGLLKKAAKKKDKIKDKSRKEWADREKDQKDQAAARIKKRSDNIAARKDRSKKGGKGIGGKKMGSGGKSKTKARAGFEGSRPRHSNKSSSGGKPEKKSSRK